MIRSGAQVPPVFAGRNDASQHRVIEVVVPANVTWLLRTIDFFFKRLQNALFDSFTARCVDRMSDVGKHPVSPGWQFGKLCCGQCRSAVGAESCSNLILASATNALFSKFATRHRDEAASLSLNDLQVTNNKFAVDRDGTKRPQSIVDVSY